MNKFVDGKIFFSIVRFNLGFLRNSVAEPDILHSYKRKKCVVFFFNVDGQEKRRVSRSMSLLRLLNCMIYCHSPTKTTTPTTTTKTVVGLRLSNRNCFQTLPQPKNSSSVPQNIKTTSKISEKQK